MNSISSLEKEALEPSTIDKLKDCIDTERHVKVPIIESFPSNIVDLMKQDLEEYKNLYRKYNPGKELPEEDYPKIIRGRLFEISTYQEYKLKLFSNIEKGTDEWEKACDEIEISSYLCRMGRYPDEYGLQIGKHDRIPDGVYVGMNKEGNFRVWGLAEAKLAKISNDNIDQIDIHGSRTTMANIVRQIQQKIDTEENEENLHPEILRIKQILNGRKIEVGMEKDSREREIPKMSLYLLAPNRGDMFENKLEFETEVSDYRIREIMNPTQKITPKVSTFGVKEIADMSKVIMDQMFSADKS